MQLSGGPGLRASQGVEDVKFFLPHAHDPSQEHKIYADLRDFLAGELGAHLTDRKIFRVTYRHEGRDYPIEVGKPHPDVAEVVDAILHDGSIGVYYLCTRSHGVVRGHPIVVNVADVESEELFDE